MEYLLCAMHCSKCFIGIDLFVTTTYEAGAAFFPPLFKDVYHENVCNDKKGSKV